MKLAILSRNSKLYSTRRLVEAARQRGHTVRVLDPLRCYMRIASSGFQLHYKGRSLAGYDAVMHVAGIPHPLNDPAKRVFDVNVNGTFNVLEAAAQHGIAKVVFTSSESTMGFAFAAHRLAPLYIPVDESHPARPQDPYGLSKVVSEQICKTYSDRFGLRTVCLRMPWVWLPDDAQHPFYRSLVAEYPQWYKNLWTFVDARDVATAHRLALEVELEQQHEAFFITGPHNWTGRDGRAMKEDVARAVAAAALPAPAAVPAAPPAPRAPVSADDAAREERVKMTRLRQTIARRLKESQNTAAQLTTFNEVDMTNVMALRNQYKDVFEKRHGVKLGFMSFFTKAVVQALHEIPAVNAEIDGTDIIYKNYCHIGVAVGTDKGLVVPIVRDADQMSIAEIEKDIGRLGKAARDGQLSMADMQGGTFTISNGGVYGSLMSSPILNAPQSGILGMHKIQERPVVVGGQIVIRPMMYLALSYDHRIVDGKEAVTFLVRVKESLEDPERLVLDL